MTDASGPICRSCGQPDLSPILSLGITPLADRLVAEEDLSREEIFAPLDLVLCPACSLVQITETVAPEILFHEDYPYFSSVSSTLLDHSRINAEELIESRRLGPSSLVIEIGSNDGYMLRNFVAHGIPVLGVDPALPPAQAAIAAGIPTRIEFFGESVAAELAAEGQNADLIIANNVLAHVADLNGLVAGIATLLKPKGIAVLEFPYLADLVDRCEFDTIYHQHLCYFSVTAVDRLFRRHGLIVTNVRRLPIHGGSLRIYVQHDGPQSGTVLELLDSEDKRGLTKPGGLEGFANSVREVREQLTALLRDLKQEGNSIVAYGAAAKGTTLLAYCDIDSATLDYVVDRSPFKQGRYMPGNHLAILPPERLVEDHPDYVLLLPWNLADEILKEQTEYRSAGGKFIVPIPRPHVL
jgi:SAM-dependent methyltransferase